MVSHVFKLDTKKWVLQQFKLSGICIQQKSFKEMRSNLILALDHKSPKLLVTSQDSDFLKNLRLVHVRNDFEIEDLNQWDTSSFYCEQAPGKPKLNLYEQLIYYQEQRYSFRF